MTVRHTHTFAALELSAAAYNEIRQKLEDAGYGNAITDDVIDMHGIGLTKEDSPKLELVGGIFSDTPPAYEDAIARCWPLEPTHRSAIMSKAVAEIGSASRAGVGVGGPLTPQWWATVAVSYERTLRESESKARLQALTEVHEYYEFDATTEEQFDAWLHERIKQARTATVAAG